MRTLNDSAKINLFLQTATPIIIDLVGAILKSTNWRVERKGKYLDTVFSIKSGENETVFYMHNLLLEIATVDRDQNPLRFDQSLKDINYFIEKMVRLSESKLNILFQLFGNEDIEKAIAEIEKNSDQYERIRIMRFDQNPAK